VICGAIFTIIEDFEVLLRERFYQDVFVVVFIIVVAFSLSVNFFNFDFGWFLCGR